MQTQVLPYLRELHAGGASMTLLTFEPMSKPWSAGEREAVAARLAGEGIEWLDLPYHHRPNIAKVLDVIRGVLLARRVIRRRGIRIVHGRAHVATLIAAMARAFTSAKLLFDIRGLIADEYVSGGNWKADGLLYRIVKRLERWLIAHGDGFVVLTKRAREHLFASNERRPVEVIPTCTDVSVYAPAAAQRDAVRAELGVESLRVWAYVGSLGTWYRTDELADFLSTAWSLDQRCFILCLTPADPGMMMTRLLDRGVPRERVLLRRVAPAEVPRYLAAADVAVSFSVSDVARLAASPTKVGEYLASGLPVVHSAGVGDVDELLTANDIGVLIRDYDRSSYAAAIEGIDRLLADPRLADRCRDVARNEFDLRTVGGPRYRRLYERMLGDGHV